MKKILFILLFIYAALPSVAQNGQRATRYERSRAVRSAEDTNIYYGVRLGVISSSISSDTKSLDANHPQTGLSIGFAAGFQMVPGLPVYLETGLYYQEKGGRGYDAYNTKFTYDLNYLVVPLVAKYIYRIDYDFSIQPFFGGYIACGANGKYKYYGDRTHDRISDDAFKGDKFQYMDGGLKIGCGAAYQMLYAEVGYDFGLANICHDDFDKSTNGCFYANIGINF